MGTSWSDVISNSAMLFIDDIRLKDELSISPALFFRHMSLYMERAIPLMARPPLLLLRLQNGLEVPAFSDYEWVSTSASTTSETVVTTDCIGYEVFSCVVRTENSAEDISLTPYTEATYNAENGTVTFPIQQNENIIYQMDFYNDGYFSFDLTYTQKRLLGKGIAACWDERFSRNWLNMQMKIHDSTFDVVNESTYTEKTTNRFGKMFSQFCGELAKYEQDCEYVNVVATKGQNSTWVLI